MNTIVALSLTAMALGWSAAGSAQAESPIFEVTGMTFVSSREADTEVVVHARQALYDPDTQIAHLTTVRAHVTEDGGAKSFEMSCDRATLNIETSDFVAEGNVKGKTVDDRHFVTELVRYDHERGLLTSDAPVVIEDSAGTVFEGGGFEYRVEDQRFRLLGGAKVIQQP